MHMFLYENKYGHSANDHTLRPQFEIRGKEVYPTLYNKEAKNRIMPWFEIKGNQVYKTTFHPEGHSLNPIYNMRGNEFHNTIHHVDGVQPHAAFHLR